MFLNKPRRQRLGNTPSLGLALQMSSFLLFSGSGCDCTDSLFIPAGWTCTNFERYISAYWSRWLVVVTPVCVSRFARVLSTKAAFSQSIRQWGEPGRRSLVGPHPHSHALSKYSVTLAEVATPDVLSCFCLGSSEDTKSVFPTETVRCLARTQLAQTTLWWNK